MFSLRHAAVRATAAAARRAPLMPMTTTTIIPRQFSIAAPRAFSKTCIVRDQDRPLEPLEETAKPGVESGVTLESEEKLAQALEKPAAATTVAEARPAAEALNALEKNITPQDAATKAAETARIREEKERSLFVQNISWDVTEDVIREDFSAFGEITSIYRPGGRATWCIVIFSKPESMNEAAKQVDGTFWHGRRITAAPRRTDEVRKDRREVRDRSSRPPSTPSPYLYIGNLPYDISDAELTGLFDSVNNATGVRIATDPSTGMPRGFAHVDFRSLADAQKAFEVFTGTTIRGRTIIVDYAERKEQASRRPPVTKARNADWTKSKYRAPKDGEASS